ncbi:MAG: AsnC family protein, partial [Oxalobacteraceae bacterium]
MSDVEAAAMRLDRTDQKILDHLQRDGRATSGE